MISAIISHIARELVLQNDWLSEVRSVGYLTRISIAEVRDKFTVTDFEKEIGITDKEGNSGYIRFNSDTNFNIDEATPQFSGCGTNQRIAYNMKLVVVAKTTVPEDISLLLAMQLSGMTFPNSYRPNQVKVIPRSGGNNSGAIVLNESGDAQWNQNYRAMYIDFTIQFTLAENCLQISTDMSCDNCETILDLGCHQSCDSVGIGMNANGTGTITLKTIFNGTQVTQSFEVENGEEIRIPLEGLNEDYEFNIQLFDSNGDRLSIVTDAGTYDCVKIKVMP